MSLFVTPQNQKLMWDIIQTNPLVNSYFSVQRSITKEEWFRSIIERFYIQYKDVPLTNPQLHELNKTAISFMIQSIYQMNGNNVQGQSSPTQQQYPPPLQQPPSHHSSPGQQIQTPPIVENNREQIYKSEFERKKEEYDSMVRKEVPKPIQFQESTEDTPISDMDALIKQHMDDREKSIQSLQPQLNPQHVVSPTSQQETNKKIDHLTNLVETLQQEIVLLKTQMKQFSEPQSKDNKALSYSSLSIVPEENSNGNNTNNINNTNNTNNATIETTEK
jgi:hypothetical protein